MVTLQGRQHVHTQNMAGCMITETPLRTKLESKSRASQSLCFVEAIALVNAARCPPMCIGCIPGAGAGAGAGASARILALMRLP